MNILLNTRFIVLSALLLGMGCERQILNPEPFDESQVDYFPLHPGHYVVYQTDSLIYDPVSGGIKVDSTTTFVKELVADTLTDNAGNLLFTIEHYERKALNAPWQLKFISSASSSTGQAILTEMNLRFLKMIFPMDSRSNWDGNLWIDKEREIEVAGERIRPFKNWDYSVDSIDVISQIGQFTFDSTLVITEADNNNVIERRFSRAWYAKHIGLVKKEQWILDSQYCNQIPIPTDCTSIPWEQKAEKGYILRQVVLEYN